MACGFFMLCSNFLAFGVVAWDMVSYPSVPLKKRFTSALPEGRAHHRKLHVDWDLDAFISLTSL